MPGIRKVACQQCRKKFPILVGNKNNGRLVRVVCPHCVRSQMVMMK